ncbi:MAG: hypothetical protein CUN52_07270 [Phototrophicales bacterium]|nr:MAG: hypothetical protein CUN52_07270 [Phototrophicales bacterium]
MNITRQVVSDQLLAYLNQELTLAQLVDWAENTFIDDTLIPDEDIPLLNDILMYLAGADTSQFSLTWDICADFMAKLGTPVKVIRQMAEES